MTTTKRLMIAGLVVGGVALLGASGVYIKRHGFRRTLASVRGLFVLKKKPGAASAAKPGMGSKPPPPAHTYDKITPAPDEPFAHIILASPDGQLKQREQASEVRFMFDRPMVELSAISKRPDPRKFVSIEPKIAGEFRWASTRMLIFTVKQKLALSTRYTVTVRDMAALDGKKLKEPYQLSFDTPRQECWVYGPDEKWLKAEDHGQLMVKCEQPADGPDIAAHMEIRFHTDQIDVAIYSPLPGDLKKIIAADPGGAKVLTERLARQSAVTRVALSTGAKFIRGVACPDSKGGYCYWMTINDRVPLDSEAEVLFKEGISSKEGPLPSDETYVAKMPTPTSLLIGLKECRMNCNPEDRFKLEVRGESETAGMFERKITVRDLTRPGEPVIYGNPVIMNKAKRKLADTREPVETDETSGDESYEYLNRNPLELRWAHLKAGHTYEIEFDPSITTRYGHQLGYRSITTVSLGNHPAYARLRGGERVMERGNTAGLRVHLRNVTQLTQVRRKVGKGDLVALVHDYSQEKFTPAKYPTEPLNLSSKLNNRQQTLLKLAGTKDFTGVGIYLLGMMPAKFEPLSQYDDSNQPWRKQERGGDETSAGDDVKGDWTTALLQLTDLAVTIKESPIGAFISVTSLKKGLPVAGAKVELYGEENSPYWNGTTDVNGFAWGKPRPVVRPCKYCTLIAVAQKDDDLAYTQSSWTEGYGGDWQWRYSNSEDDAGEGDYVEDGAGTPDGALFTDRGIYKLGETVSFKGIVRAKKSRAVEFLTGETVTLKVTDDRNSEVFTKQYTPSKTGGFDGSFIVPATGSMGTYRLSASFSKPRTPSFYASFLVTTFRRPDFKVDAASKSPDYIRGDKFEGTIRGAYLFGAPMDGRDISWELRSGWTDFDPTEEHPELGLAGYSWRFWCQQGEECWNQQYDYSENNKLDGKATKLDKKGELKSSVLLPVMTTRHTAHRLQYEGTVTDINRQELAGRVGALVHPGEFYVGIKTGDRFTDYGGEIRGTAAAVTPDGRWKADVKLTARLIRWEWNSVIRKTGDESSHRSGGWSRIEIASTELISAKKPVPFSLKPDKSGFYEVNVMALDGRGNWIEAGTDSYVLGAGYVPWRNDYEQDSLKLLPERQTYAVGETAKVLVQSPWAEAEGLLTIERGEVLEAHRFQLRGSATAVKIPIAGDHTPNIYVSVTLFKGRTAPPKPGLPDDPGRPQVKSGTIELKVPPKEKRLKVMVSADAEEYRPAAQATASVSVTDFKNKPAPGEVTLWAVDEGILRLTNYQMPDLISIFFSPRAHEVTTADGRMKLIAMASDEEKGAASAATAPEAGGGGGQDANGQTIRSDFRVLAVWVATLPLDANGKASTTFKLPESLSSYRIMAVAESGEDQFGSGQSTLRIKKPFMLLPVMPRFLNLDDKVEAGAVLHNQTGKAGLATIKINLPKDSPLALEEAAEKTLTLEPGPTEVRFRLRAVKTGQAQFSFTGTLKSGRKPEADGVQVAFPVMLTRRLETVAAAGLVEQGKPQVEKIRLPGEVYPDLGGLEFELSSSALAGLQDGVGYLVDYPYGCLEQRSSRVKVLMLLKDLKDVFPLPGLQGKDLKGVVEKELRQIGEFQRWDGGLGYWKESTEADLYLTAKVVELMVDARKLGFSPPADVEDKAIQYMQGKMRESRDGRNWDQNRNFGDAVNTWNEWWDAESRAIMLFSLAHAGYPEPAINDYLFEHRERLTIFGQIHLLRAMAESGQTGEKPRKLLREALNNLRIEANQAFVQNDYAYAQYGGSPGYAYLYAGDTHNSAALLTVLLKINPKEPLAPLLARWLLAQRKNGVWLNTLENGYALAGLVDYYRAQEPDSPDFKAVVKLGVTKVLEENFRGRSLDVKTSKKPMTELTDLLKHPDQATPLEFSVTGKGRLYYSARLKYAPLLRNLTPLDAGFTVERSYLPFQSDGARTSFNAGDMVRVRLRITTAQARRNVVIDDPLPAGFEPLNAALATTSREHLIGGGASDRSGRNSSNSWRSGIDHTELHNERVLLFATQLNPGTLVYDYVARATSPGKFIAPPTQAEEMYRPEIFGRSGVTEITVVSPGRSRE